MRERRRRQLFQSETTPTEEITTDIPNVGSEVEILLSSDDIPTSTSSAECEKHDQPTESIYASEAVQCEIITTNEKYSVEQFKDDPVAIHYYTGFDDYEHLNFFLTVLGHAAYNLNYQNRDLTVLDHLFMTMMKLRQAKDDAELSIMFRQSPRSVARILQTWINFMYYQLKELDLWASKEAVVEHMPLSFGRMFPNTRIVLDATECAIEKPSHVGLQSSTFSSYKNKNTVKTMIGCTPRGAVSYISDSYGGSTTDRQIMERSTLCSQSGLFNNGDSIMADRGIMVQDLFASQNVSVNTPHMLRGKSQLEPADVVHDRGVSSKRIHIERVIGLAKTFKILERTLPCQKIKDAHKIIFICFAITNFRNCIVNKYA